MQKRQIVFFDIGSTLGMVGFDASGAFTRFDAYPYISAILETIKDSRLSIGIIANTGSNSGAKVNEVISQSSIWQYVDKDLTIYSADVGSDTTSPRIFEHAASIAKTDPSQCLYVGEDSWERLNAAKAGMRVCPHPQLALEILAGQYLHFVKLSPPEEMPSSQLRIALHGKPFVPLHVSGRGRSTIIGIASNSCLLSLANAQISVDLLGPVDAPLFTDLYILRDDKAARTGFLSVEGQSTAFFDAEGHTEWLLSSSVEGLLVALPAGRSVEEYHFDEAYHGHNLKLGPDLALLTSFDSSVAAASFFEVGEVISEDLSDSERLILSHLTDAVIERNIGAYIGAKPAGDGGEPIRSRHIHSDDNQRVVSALTAHFSLISDKLQVHLHPFTHEGKQLFNVEAEIGPNNPSDYVLVTAHLDSTAAFSHPYDPATDQALGVDDNASGVAGVLSIAEVIASLASLRPLARAIRFVLFNAEEHGLVGSKAYARNEAARAARIVAVLQMDMIGYNVDEPRSWELHAGYWPSPEVQRLSLALAERVSRLTANVSPELDTPQLYVSKGPMPVDRDPAEGRSDHAAFHERGYPACVASEDFFSGPIVNAPQPEANPNYHTKGDTFVDAKYAADIARAVAATAWVLARRPDIET